MKSVWGILILVSLLASSVFAQLPMWRAPGRWHTESAAGRTMSILITHDKKHALVVSHENGRVSFGIESPIYLKAQGKKLRAMVRFDSDLPKMVDFMNVDRHMAFAEKDIAQWILERLATAKRLRVRMVNYDDAHCWELAFFDIVVNLPANTQQVMDKVLNGSD